MIVRPDDKDIHDRHLILGQTEVAIDAVGSYTTVQPYSRTSKRYEAYPTGQRVSTNTCVKR
jgi:hypothetical protein